MFNFLKTEPKLEHPGEISIIKPILPDFYYKIDHDKNYTSDEILDLCKEAHNNAVKSCIKKVNRENTGTHMATYRREMERTLVKVII